MLHRAELTSAPLATPVETPEATPAGAPRPDRDLTNVQREGCRFGDIPLLV